MMISQDLKIVRARLEQIQGADAAGEKAGRAEETSPAPVLAKLPQFTESAKISVQNPKDDEAQFQQDITAEDIIVAEANLSVLTQERDRFNRQVETASEVLARLRRRLNNLREVDRPAVTEQPDEAKRAISVIDVFTRAEMEGKTLQDLIQERHRLDFQIKMMQGRSDPKEASAVAKPMGFPTPESALRLRGPNPSQAYPQGYVSAGKLVIFRSQDGRVVTGYSSARGETRSFRLISDDAESLKITPFTMPSLAALQLHGKKVERVAVFSATDGDWHGQDLVEATEVADPVLSPSMAYYLIGRRVYAFSAACNRWGMLELSDDDPNDHASIAMEPEMIYFLGKKKLHLFSATTGGWTSIEVDTTTGEEPPEETR